MGRRLDGESGTHRRGHIESRDEISQRESRDSRQGRVWHGDGPLPDSGIGHPLLRESMPDSVERTVMPARLSALIVNSRESRSGGLHVVDLGPVSEGSPSSSSSPSPSPSPQPTPNKGTRLLSTSSHYLLPTANRQPPSHLPPPRSSHLPRSTAATQDNNTQPNVRPRRILQL
jgi:hypothetical protein